MTKTEFIEKLSEIELAEANIKHPPKFANWHEAYAVAKEELEVSHKLVIERGENEQTKEIRNWLLEEYE